MAVSIPSSFKKWELSYPFIVNSVSVSRAGNRAISFVETNDDFWQVDMLTKPLLQAEKQLLEGFIDSCQKGLVTVHFKPTHTCLLREYWGNATNPAVLNEGNLTAITNGQLISFNSVTTGLKISAGDLIGLSIGDYNYIVRASADQTAVAGAITNLPVQPPIPKYITTGAAVKFKDPVMNMRLLPNSYKPPNGSRPTLAFTLVEVPK